MGIQALRQRTRAAALTTKSLRDNLGPPEAARASLICARSAVSLSTCGRRASTGN